MYSVIDGARVGTYTPNKDNDTRWLCIDFDGGKKHPTPLAEPWAAASEASAVCKNLGIPGHLEKSGGGAGWHLWTFFGKPFPAAKARALGLLIASRISRQALELACGGTADPEKGRGVEIFPKTTCLSNTSKGTGGMVWLPWYRNAPEGANVFYREQTSGEWEPYLPEDFAVADEQVVDALLAAEPKPETPAMPEPAREVESNAARQPVIRGELPANGDVKANPEAFSPIDNILLALKDVSQQGTGWKARCPAHDDSKPSLSVAVGSDGKVLVKCFAGCTFEQIASGLGMKPKEFFPRNGSTRPQNQQAEPAQSAPAASQPKKNPYRDWPYMAGCAAEEAAKGHLLRLAETLGVREDALRALGVGYFEPEWTPDGTYHAERWTFPEKDAAGKIIGLKMRNEAGDKKAYVYGSHAGLSYTQNWHYPPGPAFIVEGGTDTAALHTLALCAVGRPFNEGGLALLIELFRDFVADRQIVVVAERDEKPDGHWPGRDAAIKMATALADALKRPVYWAFPPGNAKDSRAWLNAQAPDLRNIELLDDLGERFTAEVLAGATECQPAGVPKDEPRPGHDEEQAPPESIMGKGRGCGAVFRFDDLNAPGVQVHMKILCGRWSCSICAKNLKAKWTSHLHNRINPLPTAFVWSGSAKDWSRIRKAIHLAKGDYVRIRNNDGSLLVVASAAPDSFRQMPGAEAFALAWKAIWELSPCKRPISTSEGWKPEEEEAGEQKRHLRRVGHVGSNDLRTHRTILQAFGLKPERWNETPSRVAWALEFQTPHTWSKEDQDNLELHLLASVVPAHPQTLSG